MSQAFDAEQYVEKWDRLVIPVMSAFILISLAATFWLQFAVDGPCSENRYIYCGSNPAHHGDASQQGHGEPGGH